MGFCYDNMEVDFLYIYCFLFFIYSGGYLLRIILLNIMRVLFDRNAPLKFIYYYFCILLKNVFKHISYKIDFSTFVFCYCIFAFILIKYNTIREFGNENVS